MTASDIWVTYKTQHPTEHPQWMLEDTRPAPNSAYTYVLRDPLHNREPIYVGKGKNSRGFDHHKRTDNHPLTRRLGWMLRRGVHADVEVIPALDEKHALFMEECLISIFGRADLKKGPLLNLTDGGDGVVNLSAERRAAIGVRLGDLHRGKPKSPKWREKMSAIQMSRHDERRQTEAPLFAAALANPVLRLSGAVNQLGTANKHQVNFKRFRKWIENGCK